MSYPKAGVGLKNVYTLKLDPTASVQRVQLFTAHHWTNLHTNQFETWSSPTRHTLPDSQFPINVAFDLSTYTYRTSGKTHCVLKECFTFQPSDLYNHPNEVTVACNLKTASKGYVDRRPYSGVNRFFSFSPPLVLQLQFRQKEFSRSCCPLGSKFNQGVSL